MELTEQRGVDNVMVYGFLRATVASPLRQQALLIALAHYCDRHELLLAGTFTERSRYCSAAFTGLLDALALPSAYGVVLPAPTHLGTRRLAEVRRKRLVAVGARLHFVRKERRTEVAGDELGVEGAAGNQRPPAAGVET